MVAIIGANGSGKTNILEAISLFAPGRGMRGAETAELQMQDKDGWGVQITLSDNAQLSTGVAAGAVRRSVLINGATGAQTDLRDYLTLLWLTPEDDFVLARGTSARRALLDRFVGALDASHAGRLQQLQKSLSERLRILQTPRPDHAWLTAVEKEIAERGTAVAAARINFLEQLLPYLENDLATISAVISGDIEAALQHQTALQVEENYAAQLQSNRAEDVQRGQTNYGAHRSDLRITYLAKNQPAERCSTGEQKSILFSLFLATAQLVRQHDRRPPVLLLDECLSHLDEARRMRVLDHISSLQSQCFWTGTEENHPAHNTKIIRL